MVVATLPFSTLSQDVHFLAVHPDASLIYAARETIGGPVDAIQDIVSIPVDLDGDGVAAEQGDCNDNDPDIYPGAQELCDEKDNDCNGEVDDDPFDVGQACNTGQPGVCGAGVIVCQDGDLICEQTTQPSAEICDGRDNDCDGQVDEGNPGGVPCNTGQPGVFKFSAATYNVSEATSSMNITVQRTGTNLVGGISVNYAVTSGTATGGGMDYTLAAGTLAFNAGEVNKTFSIQITNDTLAEGPETVLLTLSSPTGGATLRTPSTATLTITDNDLGGVIKFSLAAYSTGENVASGTTNLTVTRTGGMASGVTVSYAVTGGAAVSADYMLAVGMLTFSAGVASLPIPVTIINDGLAEGNETVRRN